MLILSRKTGETIVIGTQAETKVTILQVNQNQVKLGIDAPKTISVHRQEIYQQIQAEKNKKEN